MDHDEDDLEDPEVIENTNSSVLTLNSKLLQQVTENCPSKGVQMITQLYEALISKWSEYISTKKYSGPLLLIVLKIWSLHGVPFDCDWKIFKWLKHFAVMHCLYKITPTQNLGFLFQEISQFENALRWNIWLETETVQTAKKHKIVHEYRYLRGQFFHLVKDLNYRGMANLLSYTRYIRKQLNIIQYMSNVTSSFQFATQCIIAANQDRAVDMGNNIIILAENCLKNMRVKSFSPLIAHMCELLIVCLVFNDLQTATILIAMESNVNENTKYFKHKKTWQAYRRLSEYLMFFKDADNMLIDGAILAEDLKNQFDVFDDERAIIFAEAAIRIYIENESYDQLCNCLQIYARRAPRRVKLMSDLLRSLGLDHESEIAVESACNQFENRPHPSEIIWIDWCEMRLKKPGGYGPLEDVYANCVRDLFQFLDFGTNRSCDRAWLALHFALPNVDRLIVAPLWEERSSWWPIFHHKSIHLSSEAQKCREKIFFALDNELS